MEDIIESLEQEIEDTNETEIIKHENNLIDDYFAHKHRSDYIEAKFLLVSTVGFWILINLKLKNP